MKEMLWISGRYWFVDDRVTVNNRQINRIVGLLRVRRPGGKQPYIAEQTLIQGGYKYRIVGPSDGGFTCR